MDLERNAAAITIPVSPYTYLPLSMRPGHNATARAITAARQARRANRVENAIIDRVDLDRKRAADRKLAAMKPVGKVC